MKKCGLLIFVVASLALAAGCGGGDSGVSNANSQAQFAGPGKTCSVGYVRAKVPWGVKCLVNGELCKAGRKRAYVRWGFRCVKGRLVNI